MLANCMSQAAVAKKCICAGMYKSCLLDVVLQDEQSVSFGLCFWKRCFLTRQSLKDSRENVLQKRPILR